jgi:hypothetical protein
VCSGLIPPITDPGAGGAKSYAQRSQEKGMKGSKVVSVNMHHLGESFVEKVSDVRRRATVDGEATAPGESMEFLAFFIPEVHFAKETPRLEDDEGWWYQVRLVIWCRECRKCGFRKEREGFERNEWKREQPAICTRCDMGNGAKRASSGMTRKVRKRVKDSPNPQARRPRAAHGKGVAARNATSESEEDEAERVEWGTRQYGVRMSPAHPWYVGRGDDTCGGEVVYSIQEIKKLLSSQPEDMKRWLTTSQMGWALTREENEVVNEKDEREGKPVARQLAPMISTFIRAQWESGEWENK